MAKLPPKPRNPVHEFFPVGADGQSPMNKGAFDVYLEGKDKDKDGDTLFNKVGEFDPGESPEEKAARILKLKADTNKATQEGLLKKIDYYKDNPIVDDPANPGKKIRKKDLEARKKSESAEVGKGASNELDEVVLTPNNKVIGPGLGVMPKKKESLDKSKKDSHTPKQDFDAYKTNRPNRGKKIFIDTVNAYKKRWK